VDRITSLARGLYRTGGGSNDGEPWPYDALLHAWWVVPDQLLAGEYPGHTDAFRTEAKISVLVDAGIRTFVDLTTPADGLAPYQPTLESVAARRDLDLHRLEFPIADLDVVNDDAYADITDAISQSLGRGGAYVHCWGGVGRTGTVIGCLLADQGLTHDEVLERLVALRKGTRKAARPIPETKAQRDVIRRRASRSAR
jgi:predicted protein tyrosine phosphatase